MKQRRKPSSEIRIENVASDVKKGLINVAKNHNTTLTALLKPKLREILEGYPESMKKPPLEY